MKANKQFVYLSEQIAFDLKKRNTIQENLSLYQQGQVKNTQLYTDYELQLSRAAYLRKQSIHNLDQYLMAFEQKITQKGGKVIWAENAKEAQQEILNIIKERSLHTVIQGQSTTSTEIDLENFLQKNQITPLKSSVSQFIASLSKQESGHFTDALSHLSSRDILEILKKEVDDQTLGEPKVLLDQVKKILWEQLQGVKLGISGANFLLADTGGIAITENEGNIRLINLLCDTHIVLAGIDKVIAHTADLDIFWTLLAGHATGQTLSAYNSIITAPANDRENEGATELIVILLDNGRTDLLSDTQQKSALYCIGCGACQNVCPVYNTLGGQAYQNPYTGPIGAILSPYLQKPKKLTHLSQASTLCGACNTVCPVKIDLVQLLQNQREQILQRKLSPNKEGLFFRLWKNFMVNKQTFVNISGKRILALFDYLFKGNENRWRNKINAPKKTFENLWKNRK